MRFASIGSANAGRYASAGAQVANSAARVFDVQRKTGPDYAGLSETAMRTQSNEKVTAMRAAAHVTKAGINELERKTKLQHGKAVYDNAKDIKSKQRKAGAIAAIGKIGGAAYLASRKDDRELPTNSKEKNAVLQQSLTKQRAILDRMAENESKGIDAGDAAIDSNKSKPSSGTAGSGGSAGKVTGGGGTSLGTGLSGSNLTGNAKTLADAIAKYESGEWGYEAFNQGGAAGGTRVVGKSGNHKQQFGRSLTDMTLNEIFDRQNTKQKGMSFQQHLDSGGLHAVGRYQFIGSTLQNEVKRMGLDPNTKFTPEVQDQIFLSHIKRVGSISPWVGPMQNYSSSQRAQFNSMIQGL